MNHDQTAVYNIGYQNTPADEKTDNDWMFYV